MIATFRLGTLFSALLLLACPPACAQADSLTPFIEGKVLRVLDGDTIVLLDAAVSRQLLVRLRGAEAPELAQPAGSWSRQHLAGLLVNKPVKVEFKFIDKYGRLIGRVLLDDEDMSLRQLSAGCAWFHTTYTNELSTEERQLYTQAEQEAHAARRGLWQERTPVAPWDFRNSKGLTDEPVVEAEVAQPAQTDIALIGNRRTKLYYAATCPDAGRIPVRLRARFKSSAAAARAGYKAAPGCR